jgi:hypothetical protein
MNISALGRALRARLSLFGDKRAARRSRISLIFVGLALLAGVGATCTPLPNQIRVDLVVLILDDGTNTGVNAIREELKLEGVPYREIKLSDPARPVIDAAFLATISGTNPVTERARFQAVVSADEGLTGLAEAERAAVHAYEVKYGIRHVAAGTWANPAVGLNYAQNPGFVGSLDGMTASVTPAGVTSPFNYVSGTIPFEGGSYGYLATPLATLPPGATFTSLVTVPIPGTTTPGTILGVYNHDGRQELVVTTSFHPASQQFRVLGRGIVTWMTKGVHLGHSRSYLTVHVDDLFEVNARWNSALNCTPGNDCPTGTPKGRDIRMTGDDFAAVVAWQQANGFRLDWAFNGFGSAKQLIANGADPLLDAAKAYKGQFGWINHTYSHRFLGCQRDMTVVPWRCETDSVGAPVYADQATVTDEINENRAFATTHGLPIDPAELVTGEHSGLFILPQQPEDNPNLAPAFAATGVTTVAADASRQFNTRLVGNTRTVPRYPMANFFNVATKAELVDEYNWIFTSAADGGSGLCTANPATMTCLPPINVATGYEDDIIPGDTRLALRHVLGNDPRPHYVHQSNLAEERILLPLMSSVLGRYRSMFNTTVPLVSLSQTQAATLLARQAEWSAGSSQVEAYTLNGTLYVNKRAFTGAVPITVPMGSRVNGANGPVFGEPYASESSAWVAFNGTYLIALAKSGA